MIYYSILDPKGQLITTIEENWLEPITSIIGLQYKKQIKICKINIDRYVAIDSRHIKDKVMNEVIFCGNDQEQGLRRLNQLNRIRERRNAKIRAMEMIK